MDLLYEANRLAGQLAVDFKKSLVEVPQDIKRIKKIRTIAIFSGRFQPFHEGHNRIYKKLKEKFGNDNVFIVSTDDDAESLEPLSYEDKKHIMTNVFKISSNKIQKVENPYVPKELLQHFDPNTTAFVTIVSDRAIPVLSHSKYFHKYVEGLPLRTFKEAGYYLPIPAVIAQMGKTNLTEPLIMTILNAETVSPALKDKLIQRLFGTTDAKTKEMLTTKGKEDVDDIEGKFSKSGITTAEPKGTQATAKTDADNAPYPKGKDNDEEGEAKNPMDGYVVNPETKNKIKVRSALKYPRWTPVYKKAEKMAKAAGVDRKDRVEDPEVNQRYRTRAEKKDENIAKKLGEELAKDMIEQLSLDKE